MKIALISCSSKKYNETNIKAEKLYSKSILFRLTLQYCKQQKYDKIFILSTKYGLINIDESISYYDLTLNKMNINEKKRVGKKISEQLNKILNIYDDIYIFAGKNYYKYIDIKNNIYLPLNNLPIGKRIKWLKFKIKENIKNENVVNKS